MKFTPKKKILMILVMLICAVVITTGTTLAFLTATSGTVENVFTIGNIKLSLVETTGESYQLIPGKEINKNPKVIVEGGSEDCWLFIKITKTEHFDEYINCNVDSGWTHLGGYEGVYYRSVVKSYSNNEFRIIENDTITVKENLTEEKMHGITVAPKLTFKAYAVQSYSIDSASEAWQQILQDVEE